MFKDEVERLSERLANLRQGNGWKVKSIDTQTMQRLRLALIFIRSHEFLDRKWLASAAAKGISRRKATRYIKLANARSRRLSMQKAIEKIRFSHNSIESLDGNLLEISLSGLPLSEVNSKVALFALLLNYTATGNSSPDPKLLAAGQIPDGVYFGVFEYPRGQKIVREGRLFEFWTNPVKEDRNDSETKLEAGFFWVSEFRSMGNGIVKERAGAISPFVEGRFALLSGTQALGGELRNIMDGSIDDDDIPGDVEVIRFEPGAGPAPKGKFMDPAVVGVFAMKRVELDTNQTAANIFKRFPLGEVTDDEIRSKNFNDLLNVIPRMAAPDDR